MEISTAENPQTQHKITTVNYITSQLTFNSEFTVTSNLEPLCTVPIDLSLENSAKYDIPKYRWHGGP